MTAPSRFSTYLRLIRFERPIGTFLLLWPTWWGLWFAAGGVPTFANLLIFTLGTFLTRSAGCAINDFADRDFDAHVARTRDRPLAQRHIGTREALAVAAVLGLAAFALVLFTNRLTIWLSFGGAAIATLYPFLKRHTHLPQLALGMAFSWGIPMAFAAERDALPSELWLVYGAAVLWTIVYDTFYAMVDREDDLRIGVKSTAILFGESDRAITALLQGLVLLLLVLCGQRFAMGPVYYASIAIAAILFAYQQWLIRERERMPCFKAFLHNNYVGLAIFAGIAADYLLRSH